MFSSTNVLQMLSTLCLFSLTFGCGPGAADNPPKIREGWYMTKNIYEGFPPIETIEDKALLGSILRYELTELHGFEKNGFHSSVEPVDDKIIGVFGSYTQLGDAQKGKMAIKLSIPETASQIALPIISGPDKSDIHVLVLNEKREIIAQIQDPNPIEDWVWWQINLQKCDNDCGEITLQIHDTGANWGQWVAIGMPRIYSTK